jgi:Na+/melibiose symporter-like transporter
MKQSIMIIASIMLCITLMWSCLYFFGLKRETMETIKQQLDEFDHNLPDRPLQRPFYDTKYDSRLQRGGPIDLPY